MRNMWLSFIFVLYLCTKCSAFQSQICTGLTFSTILYKCTTDEKIFTHIFDLDASTNNNNASFPNRLKFSNISTWSLNETMYSQRGPMYWRYINTMFTNPTMYDPYEIDFLDSRGSFGFPFVYKDGHSTEDGYVEPLFFQMFIDKGTIFYVKSGKLFDPATNQCFDIIESDDGCIDGTSYNFPTYIYKTTACCKTFSHIEVPDNDQDCTEMETNAKVVNSDGTEIVDFAAHYAMYKDKMEISVTKFNSVFDQAWYIHVPNTYGGDCSNIPTQFSINCSSTFPSGDFQYDMMLDLYAHENINEFEAIVAQIIRRNGKLYNNNNIPYTKANPCYNRTTVAAFNDGLTVKSSSCCSKFGVAIDEPTTPPPITPPKPYNFCSKYTSNTTLSNNAASLQAEYYITDKAINLYFVVSAMNFSQISIEAYAPDTFSDMCIASTENPKSNCSFNLSLDHQYQLIMRTSLMPDGFNMLKVVEENLQFIVPSLSPSNPCYDETNPYNGYLNIEATTHFCCAIFG